MDKFNPLTRYPPSDQDLIFKSLTPSQMDVDKMEICMSPAHFLSKFGGPLSVVRLASHVPQRKSTDEGDRGHEFSDWLLIAEMGFQLWIEPKYKAAFFDCLKAFRTIQPAPHDWVATYGNALVPVTVFVRCLEGARCPTLRYKLYGQKLPLVPRYIQGEPAQTGHPQAHLNEWDIGITFKSANIFLFKPTLGMSKEMTVYPLMAPAGRDYGSVQTNVWYNDTMYKVKIYPRIVHVIKSFNSRLQGEALTKVNGVRRRIKACVQMVQHLAQIPPGQLGGFRIEVSVQAPTLAIARTWVENTPLLDIKHWSSPGQEGHRLDILITHKQAVLENANWLISREHSLKMIQGRDSNAPTRLQKQVAADILSGFGWNAGRWSVTKASDTSAWWHGPGKGSASVSDPPTRAPVARVEPGPEGPIGRILGLLNERFGGIEGTHKLLEEMRKHHKFGRVPCQVEYAHSYIVCESGRKKAPFRMRCNNGYCRHNMSIGETYRWFATLIASGQVRPRGVALYDSEVKELNIQVSETMWHVPECPY